MQCKLVEVELVQETDGDFERLRLDEERVGLVPQIVVLLDNVRSL